MKKTSSLVWRFFDRLEENKRCVGVLCKLCDSQYKYFGNTTNLRTHLVNKHPIQWDLLQNGTLDESTFRAFDEDENTNQSTAKRKRYVKAYKNDNVCYSVSVDLNKRGNNQKSSTENSMPVIEIQRVDVLENSETDHEQVEVSDEPISIVRQMHGSRDDEEWLNEEIYETVDFQPKRKKMKYRTIKREVQSPPPTSNTQKYRIVQNAVPYSKPPPVIIDSTPKKDENSIFGEYVGNRLRKFKNLHIRGNVQQLITTILWQAEYGMYDNIETVKRVLLHSVQEMEVEQPIQQIIVHEAETLTKETELEDN